MKSKIIRRFAGIVAFLMLATQISLPSFAENTTTSDNTTLTTTDTSDEDETGETDDTTTATGTTTTDSATAAATLSEEVDEDNVVDVLSDDVEDVYEDEDEEDEDDEDADDLTEEAAAEVAESLEEESEDDIAEALDDLDEEIQDEIDAINDEIAKDPTQKAKLLKKIEHLKRLLIKLRVKLIAKDKKLAAKVRAVKNPRALYEVRWGDLTGKRKRCAKVSMKDLKDSLAAGNVPEKCQTEKVEYTGKISVDTGTLEVKKELLFEDTDEVTTDSGSGIAFDSTINGHWDGFILEYTPDDSSDTKKNEVMTTITIGDLDETYKGSEALGVKKIGNGHMIQIRRLAWVLSELSDTASDDLLRYKLKVQDKANDLYGKLDRLRLMKSVGAGADDLEETAEDAGEYNFDETSTAEVEDAIEEATDELTGEATDEEIEDAAETLKDKIEKIKENAKGRKFAKKLIPFKDTDDDQWFTQYVSGVKKRGVISGYKDASGNELGEYRPANNITVAEILKIGLETAQEGKAKGKTPKLRAAVNHWAKEYVAKAEELGVDLTSATDVDLNRPATRGEVIRLILETLGLKPPKVSKTDFSDVSVSDENAAFIQYAKDLGLISGDAGKTTFRPNDPINRAEAAKISDLVFQIIFGGSETAIIGDSGTTASETAIGGDEPWD